MLSIVGDILAAWVGTGAEGKSTSAGARGLPRDRGRRARWKGVGVALNPSKLQRCSLSRLSPESRAKAESTLEACSSCRVPRRAFPSALSQLVVALYVSRACVTRDLIIDQQRRPRFGQRDRGKLEERRLSAEFSSKDREPRDSKDLSTLRLASISIAEKRPETIGSVWK